MEQAPITYEVLRQTWLTRRPRSPRSQAAAFLSSLSLLAGSVIYLLNIGGASGLMAASGAEVVGKLELWRLWTAIFAHANLGHLLSNSLLFFILGFFLHAYFGWWLFPFGAFFFGGWINLLAVLTYDPQILLIGASGVVYWMGGTWLALYFGISRQYAFTSRLVRTLGVGILIFMPAETFDPHVSYRTHAIGFVLGIAVGITYFLRHRKRFQAAEVRETVADE